MANRVPEKDSEDKGGKIWGKQLAGQKGKDKKEWP